MGAGVDVSTSDSSEESPISITSRFLEADGGHLDSSRSDERETVAKVEGIWKSVGGEQDRMSSNDGCAE